MLAPVLDLDTDTASDSHAAPRFTVRDLGVLVCDAASQFDASVLGPDAASESVRDWSVIAHAASAALALAAARVEECGPPSSAGATAAEFVAKETGTTTGKAKETIKHGQRLRGQSKTRKAATEGKLSPEKASAITDAVDVNPDAEGRLLDDAATKPVGELRLKCAEAKAEKQDVETIEREIHKRRSLRRWTDAEGAAHLHATGTKRDMARVDRALKVLIDERFRAAYRDGEREPLEAYAFDALAEMADRSIDESSMTDASVASDPADETDAAGATAATPRGAPPGRRRRKRRDPIRHLTIVRLDLAALVRGQVEEGETCEIAGLGPISVATAREMLGESVLKLVLTNGVDVRTVTHLGRGPNTAQKIALLWERPICQRRGCGRIARLQYDHTDGKEYRITKHTRLDELEPLCDDDHWRKTVLGWALVEGAGVRAMVPPDDPRHPRYSAPGTAPSRDDPPDVHHDA